VYIAIVKGAIISKRITHTIINLHSDKGKLVLLQNPFVTCEKSVILLNPLRKNINVMNTDAMKSICIYITQPFKKRLNQK